MARIAPSARLRRDRRVSPPLNELGALGRTLLNRVADLPRFGGIVTSMQCLLDCRLAQ